jgi:geranylgeranyl diphosphate synthase type II
VIGKTPNDYVSPEKKVKLMLEMAKAAGTEGMVGGQVADMLGEEKDLSLSELEYIHIHKTGKILGFCVLAGAIIAGANDSELSNLSRFAYHLGLAFQIRDDILDVEGNVELIGKPVGSDTANHKSTYPLILSMDGAKEALNQHIHAAKQYLKKTNLNTNILLEITDLIASRDH